MHFWNKITLCALYEVIVIIIIIIIVHARTSDQSVQHNTDF